MSIISKKNLKKFKGGKVWKTFERFWRKNNEYLEENFKKIEIL